MIVAQRIQELERDRLQLIQQRDNLNAQILRFEGAILLAQEWQKEQQQLVEASAKIVEPAIPVANGTE